MKITTATAVAAALVLTVPATASAQNPDASVPAPQALAVQHARSGTLTPVAGKPATYDLLLRGVGPRVMTFQDSPGNISRRITVPTLLGAAFGRATARRNAAVSAGGRSMAVTLRSGRYDAKARTMRYRVTAMRGATPLPRRLAAPTLFVDGLGGKTCSAQLTNQNTSLSLLAQSWSDPGASQTFTSNPGNMGPGGYSTWQSQGVALGQPCSNMVTYAVFGAWDTGITVTIGIGDATGSNSFFCTIAGDSTPPTHTCTLDPSSQTSGWDIDIVYDFA